MAYSTRVAAGTKQAPATGADAYPDNRAQSIAAVGSVFGALAATSCCILPVVLFGMGISGAWIGNFTQLAPYKPYLLTATVGFLVTGYWLVYRSRRNCSNEACSRRRSNWLVEGMLIAATVLAIAAVGIDYAAPYLLS